jgi:tripartite ATP-independent transporter DctM subunit
MSLAFVGLAGIATLLTMMFSLAMPVGFAMGIVGFAGFSAVVSLNAGITMVESVVWSTFSQYGLTVIPLFIFMGQIAFHSRVNEKLYSAAYAWVGHIRGGLAMATVLACSAFSAICGSNAATAATMSAVALPQMKHYRYDPRLSTGTIASGATLGVVIPPSVVLIVIGLSTGQSITRLFYGGFGAGIVLTVFLMVTITIICRIQAEWGPVGPRFTWAQRFKSLSGAIEMAVLFFLVMAGLSFGIFTPSEAGAAGSLLAVAIGLTRGGLTWEGFVCATRDTLQISGMVMFIVTGAVIFGRFLAITRIPFDIASWVADLPFSRMAIMGIIFVIYIFGGMVMDALALLLITIPIFFPVADQLGYDPVWFGVIVTVVTTLGAITTPVGATAFVVAGMSPDVSLDQVFRGVAWFFPAYLFCTLILILFPQIILFLPDLMK